MSHNIHETMTPNTVGEYFYGFRSNVTYNATYNITSTFRFKELNSTCYESGNLMIIAFQYSDRLTTNHRNKCISYKNYTASHFVFLYHQNKFALLIRLIQDFKNN